MRVALFGGAVAASMSFTPMPATALSLADLLGLSPQARQAKIDEGCKRLVDWAGQQANFAPAPAVVQARQQRRPAAGGEPGAAGPTPELRLFADELFKPVFGKAFDELSLSQRLEIHQQSFVTCQRSPTYGAAVSRLAARLGTPFTDVGGGPPGANAYGMQVLSAAVVIDAVRKMRGAGAAVRGQLEALNALPDSGASWQQFSFQKAQAEAQIGFLPPEQQEAARQQLAATARRLSASAIGDLLAQAPADTAGPDALPDLRRMLDALGAIQSQANTPEAGAARNELVRRREAVIVGLVARDRAVLQAIAGTPAGRGEWAAWYATQQDRQRDAELRAHPEVARLMQEGLAKRQEQLAPLQSQWIARIESASTSEALREVQRDASSLPIDAQTPTGQAVAQAVRLRQEGLYKAQVLGAQMNETPRPASAAPTAPPPVAVAPQPTRSSAATVDGEPTAQEMYDTIQAKLNLAAAEVRNMQGACKSGGSKNPMDALACITGTMAAGGSP